MGKLLYRYYIDMDEDYYDDEVEAIIMQYKVIIKGIFIVDELFVFIMFDELFYKLCAYLHRHFICFNVELLINNFVIGKLAD